MPPGCRSSAAIARSRGQTPSSGVPRYGTKFWYISASSGLDDRRYFHDPSGPSKAKEEDGDWTRVISTTRGPPLSLQNLRGLERPAGRSQSSSRWRQTARGGRRGRGARRPSLICETCRDCSSRGVGRKARQYASSSRLPFAVPCPSRNAHNRTSEHFGSFIQLRTKCRSWVHPHQNTEGSCAGGSPPL